MRLFKLSDIIICHFDVTLLVIFFFVVFAVVLLLLLFLLRDINFVGDHYYVHVCSTVLLNFLEPIIKIEEGISVSQIEDNENPISALVVSLGYCAIPLLSSCIPDL
jgi:hypothetical protein